MDRFIFLKWHNLDVVRLVWDSKAENIVKHIFFSIENQQISFNCFKKLEKFANILERI